jgi:hypothetical protein
MVLCIISSVRDCGRVRSRLTFVTNKLTIHASAGLTLPQSLTLLITQRIMEMPRGVFELPSRWVIQRALSKRLGTSQSAGHILIKSRLNFSCLRLQDTLFGVLWKIATARSKSVRFSSNFHQMFASACKI